MTVKKLKVSKIKKMAEDGFSKTEIAKRLKLTRKTVAKYLASGVSQPLSVKIDQKPQDNKPNEKQKWRPASCDYPMVARVAPPRNEWNGISIAPP